MNSEHLPYLIQLLAESDTLWRPTREWEDNSRAVAIMERRQQFLKYGMPFQHGGGDDAARKSAERLATELEKLPDVIFRRRKGKRVFWKLSDAGDWKMRAFAVRFLLARCLRQWLPYANIRICRMSRATIL